MLQIFNNLIIREIYHFYLDTKIGTYFIWVLEINTRKKFHQFAQIGADFFNAVHHQHAGHKSKCISRTRPRQWPWQNGFFRCLEGQKTELSSGGTTPCFWGRPASIRGRMILRCTNCLGVGNRKWCPTSPCSSSGRPSRLRCFAACGLLPHRARVPYYPGNRWSRS